MSSILDLTAVKDGTNISDAIVYISGYEKKLKKDGKSYYIAGNFMNKESAISFKVWDAPIVDVMGQTNLAGCVVKISGAASSYMNAIDIKITSIALADEKEYPKSLFLKTAPVDKLFKEFGDFIVSELSSNGVNIVQGIFKSENLFDRFKQEFAGSKMHDAQVGGLLNHTLKMLRIAKVVCQNEPRIDSIPHFKDMLHMGIIFHDIGKVYELSDFPDNDYTDAGQLLGHIVMGCELIGNAVKELPGFPKVLERQLKHCIVAHHGEFEYGSPKKPALAEALALHYADDLDAKLETFKEAISTPVGQSGEWVGFNKMLDSNIRKTII